MSNKNIDFSKGIRGKHSQANLKIVGAVENAWAVCVSKNAENFIPFKIYNIEVSEKSENVRATNELGKMVACPKSWFASVNIPNNVQKLLEKAV